MSKKIKAIIAGAVFILVLTGVIVALVLIPKQGDDISSSSSAGMGDSFISLVEKDSKTLESIHVKNEMDEYTIELVGENKWGMKALGDFKQTDVMYTNAVAAVSNVFANSLVEENCTDLAKFGLDSPSLVLEAKFTDGETVRFTTGEVSSDGMSIYTIKTGEDDVYAVPATKFSTFMQSKYQYLDLAVTPAAETDDSGNPITPKINYMEITRAGLEKPFIFEPYKADEITENSVMKNAIRMTSPVATDLNEQAISPHLYGNFGINATAVAAINPTDAQLDEYGFVTPTATMRLTYNETSNLQLTVGKGIECQHEEDEDLTGHKHVITSYYVMIPPENDIIYIVSKESLPWMELEAKNVISTIAVLPPILDLNSVDVIVGTEKNELVFIAGKDESNSKDMTATLNGKSVDIDMSKKFLQLLYASSIQDINNGVVATKPADLTYIYHYKNGKTDKVEFFVLEDRTTIISVNGNNLFVGRPGYLEKLQKELKALKNGETVNTDW